MELTHRPHHRARGALLGLLMLAMAAWCQQAWGQVEAPAPEAAEDNPYGLSDYEWRLVQKMMARHGLTPIERQQAEGRTIDRVIVETEEVFTPEDFYPDFLNMFHATSQESVIRREVLLGVGDAYDAELVSQSERNLRGPLVLAVALVLPMQGEAPDEVTLLVVTKDIWSLRTNTSFQLVGDSLDFLAVSLSENNIAGYHKFVAFTTLLQPQTFRVGETFVDPRLLGSRVQLSESVSVPLNLDTGKPEGITAQLGVGQPLYSLRTPWAWDVDLTAHTAIGRSFSGGRLRGLLVDGETPVPELALGQVAALASADPIALALGSQPGPLRRFAPTAPEQVVMPFVWRERVMEASASVTRSYGREIKQNVSGGYSIGARRFSFGEDEVQRGQFTEAQVAAFEGTLLPRSERVGAVFASYTVFTPDFVTLRNFETLALPEDFRFGPSLELGVRHADPLLGGEKRFEQGSVTYVHRLLLGPRQEAARGADVLVLSASAQTRLQDGELQDNELTALVRNYTPVFWGGRLVTRARVVARLNDFSNGLSSVGGDSGLRGFPSGRFLARSVITSNVEWRTMPVELWTLQLGLTAFYDAAWISQEEDLSGLTFLHGAGLGARLLNPVSNRVVMRFDWGFPLNELDATLFGRVSIGFEQAF